MLCCMYTKYMCALLTWKERLTSEKRLGRCSWPCSFLSWCSVEHDTGVPGCWLHQGSFTVLGESSQYTKAGCFWTQWAISFYLPVSMYVIKWQLREINLVKLSQWKKNFGRFFIYTYMYIYIHTHTYTHLFVFLFFFFFFKWGII